MGNDELTKMRDLFRECAGIIDELLALTERNEKGEDANKELESIVGRFTWKMIELNSLK